jgi:hypothetical protein
MFKTLAFFEKLETDGMAMSALTGTVTDAANKPVFNSRVDVVLSSGKRYTTFTNQQGAYRLSVPTQGNAEIHVADMVKTVALTAPAMTVSFQPGATPLQPADILTALQEVGVDFSVPEAELRDFLSNAEFTPYPAMAQALLALLRPRPLRQPVPIDVIVSNYEQTPGAASPRKVGDVDRNVLKKAILEGYNDRYLPPAQSFEETLR